MKSLRVLVAVCALLYPCMTAHAAVRYNITDLGNLGGTETRANAINDHGWVVGYSKDSSGNDRAFLWKPGDGMSDLGTLGGSFARASDINSDGQITGYSGYVGGGDAYYHAFLHDPASGMTDLGTYGSHRHSDGIAINDEGYVVGSSEYLAVAWQPGQNVRPLGGGLFESWARDVNNDELVVGNHLVQTTRYNPETDRYDSYSFNKATCWDSDGRRTDLASFYYWNNSYAFAVNSAGVIAGTSQAASDSRYHACIWRHFDNPIDLGTFGGWTSQAESINDFTQVVGYSSGTDNTMRAFIWDESAGIMDLNTLVDPSSGWLLNYAYDINNDGWIVGAGTINGQTHAFLLTPVPEPGSLLVLGSGLVGLLAFRRQNR